MGKIVSLPVVEGLEEGSPVITGPFQVLKELQDGDPVQSN
jgi:hypothetical protein